MHKHRLKFEKASGYFLFWRCQDELCQKEYISMRHIYQARFKIQLRENK